MIVGILLDNGKSKPLGLDAKLIDGKDNNYITTSEFKANKKSMQFLLSGNTIESVLTGHLVDIEGGEKEDAKIIQWMRNGCDNQTWYFYPDGTIRSPKGLCLTYDTKGYVVAQHYSEKASQKWKVYTIAQK